LKTRYRKTIEDSPSQWDRFFAEYLSNLTEERVNEETVRKLRLKLARRLRPATQS
jgi:hypothetical protein